MSWLPILLRKSRQAKKQNHKNNNNSKKEHTSTCSHHYINQALVNVVMQTTFSSIIVDNKVHLLNLRTSFLSAHWIPPPFYTRTSLQQFNPPLHYHFVLFYWVTLISKLAITSLLRQEHNQPENVSKPPHPQATVPLVSLYSKIPQKKSICSLSLTLIFQSFCNILQANAHLHHPTKTAPIRN